MICDVRQPLMEENLGWKTNFDGRRPWMADGGQAWMEGNFCGRLPWKEDDLEWKTTLDRRRLWIEDNLGWKMTLA